MKKQLAKLDIECKCGHDPREHADGSGKCQASDTRYLFKKTDRSAPCACARYRPSLFSAAMDLLP